MQSSEKNLLTELDKLFHAREDLSSCVLKLQTLNEEFGNAAFCYALASLMQANALFQEMKRNKR